MRYSRAEWLLIAGVFALSVAANLPAELQAAVPVTATAVQIVLCLLLVFALVRYVPLPIVIALSLLLWDPVPPGFWTNISSLVTGSFWSS